MLKKLFGGSSTAGSQIVEAASLKPWRIAAPGEPPSVGSVLALWQGDITQLRAGAIVNAANCELAPGGGVCGAIHDAAGPELWEECRRRAPIKTGSAVLTSGYNLAASHVIHAVGPRGQDPAALASAYTSSMDVAAAAGLTSIAFPAISTGVYGYPVGKAAAVAIDSIADWISAHEVTPISRVVMVAYDERQMDAYEMYLAMAMPRA